LPVYEIVITTEKLSAGQQTSGAGFLLLEMSPVLPLLVTGLFKLARTGIARQI